MSLVAREGTLLELSLKSLAVFKLSRGPLRGNAQNFPGTVKKASPSRKSPHPAARTTGTWSPALSLSQSKDLYSKSTPAVQGVVDTMQAAFAIWCWYLNYPFLLPGRNRL
jgi:hypothetical protein